jgi:hypothetical protein
MGSRYSYVGSPNDQNIVDLCQKLILSCIPGLKTIKFSSIEEQGIFFSALSQDQIDSAFSSEKMQFKLYLEILQRFNIAYNDPDLQIFIECLLHDKNFYAFTKKGNEKRLMTKKIIDKELKKHLLKVVPKEFRFLVTNAYFLAYINELFLPLEKNRIIITIEKFFELSLYEKNSLYDKFNINYDKYETARIWINRYRIKYKDVLEKYKNDPEYQTIEKIQSVQQIIRKSKTKPDDDKTLDHTMDDFYIY